MSVETNTEQSAPANTAPLAYCESMCVFLLLSGKGRCVPEAAHVRVHQIWMGDRANDAKAAQPGSPSAAVGALTSKPAGVAS